MTQDRQAVEVSQVPPELAPAIWERMLPKIRKGLKAGGGDCTTPEYMLSEILSGRMSMWAVHTDDVIAVVVVSVEQMPEKRVLFVELVAGERLDLWLTKINSLLRDYRDIVGADCVRALCRDGMTKALASSWRRKATLMELV